MRLRRISRSFLERDGSGYAVIAALHAAFGQSTEKQIQSRRTGAKLKYHIQTSGRSLHAQEIQFNDIRTTLQALMAIYDNCQFAAHQRL